MSKNHAITEAASDPFREQRTSMIEMQIRRRGVKDEGVLRAMMKVERHRFIPPEWRGRAYEDEPLPIGEGQTISQPYIVAAMTAMLRLTGTERVLEIGTGSGYQAAVLAEITREVFTVEHRPELARSASARLQNLGYEHVHVHCGDGTLGLVEFAPFDAILVAAAAPAVPEPLLQQLAADGGKLVAPVGNVIQQELVLVRRRSERYELEHHEGC